MRAAAPRHRALRARRAAACQRSQSQKRLMSSRSHNSLTTHMFHTPPAQSHTTGTPHSARTPHAHEDADFGGACDGVKALCMHYACIISDDNAQPTKRNH